MNNTISIFKLTLDVSTTLEFAVHTTLSVFSDGSGKCVGGYGTPEYPTMATNTRIWFNFDNRGDFKRKTKYLLFDDHILDITTFAKLQTLALIQKELGRRLTSSRLRLFSKGGGILETRHSTTTGHLTESLFEFTNENSFNNQLENSFNNQLEFLVKNGSTE